MNVVIVDDSPTNLRLLRAILESEEHSVFEAGDGLDALELLKTNRVDAIVSDILMPRMDGYRLCDEVKSDENFRHIPFIFYTATYTSPGDRKLCEDLGGDKYIVKPAGAEELLAALREVCGNAPVQREMLPSTDRDSLIKDYNERLVFKLEEKNIELFDSNTQLEETRGRMEYLLEHTPVVVYALRIEQEVIIPQAVTENVFRLLGFKPEEALRFQWWRGRVHPDDLDRALASLTEARREGSSRVEYRVYHKDGTLRWIDDHRRVTSLEKNAVEIVGAWSDITERKLAEDALRESNERYIRQELALATLTRLRVLREVDLVEAYKTVAQVVSETLKVQRVSLWRYHAVHRSITCEECYDAKEMVHTSGATLNEGAHPAYFAVWAHADVMTAHDVRNDARTSELWEKYLRPLDIVSLMDAPMRLRGNIAGLVCCEHIGEQRRWSVDEQTFLISVANLTSLFLSQVEQQKTEEQFYQAQKMEAIGQLAGGIAHDFNNILGAIVGYTGMAQMQSEDPTILEYLAEVEKGSKRATDLVAQILAFSRRQSQERKPTQIKYIIAEALKLLKASVPASIKFQTNLTSTPVVLANPTAIHQVVMNLCTNAWHAMKEKDSGVLAAELKSVEVDADFAKTNPDLQPGPYVLLSVRDTGCGVDGAILDRIFDPFFTTKGPGEGTGLGLAAVHGIVKTHDGAITVESRLGEGTAFHVYFPAFQLQEGEILGQEQPIPKGSGEKILFIDDEEPLVNVGKEILTKLGYEVTAVTQVQEALALFEKDQVPFNLVVTDLAMPAMDGLKLSAKLLEIRPNLPIILATGYSGSLTPDKVRALGLVDLLLKPITPRALGEAVHRVLRETGQSTSQAEIWTRNQSKF